MILDDTDALAAQVPDGAMLALPPDYGGVAMAATRALIRRGVRNLHLLGVPSFGIQGDMLIGAGCVAVVETAAVTLGEQGLAPRFTAAVKAGALRLKDATCPAIHAALQASEKGVPFMPLRGLIGSDLVKHRPDWRIVDNPFRDPAAPYPDPIVLLPALRPDVALFHAPMADRAGNVWIGRRRELMTMAHAAATTLVTVERITDEDLLATEESAAGVLPSLYVGGVAVAPRGAWPVGLPGSYEADVAALAAYARAASRDDSFREWLAADLGADHPKAAE